MLGIVTGLIDLLEIGGNYALAKLLRQHSDALLLNKKRQDEWKQEFLNDTDNRDDLEWVVLIREEKRLEDALDREIQLAKASKA